MQNYKVAFIYLGKAHDDYDEICQTLFDLGINSELVHLDDATNKNWHAYDLVDLRMCRGLHLKPDFVERVKVLQKSLNEVKEKRILLYNPVSILSAAIDKEIYLRELEKQGVAIVPTRWIAKDETSSIEKIMEETGWNEVVLKPTVSTLSWRTFRISLENNRYYVLEPKPESEAHDKSDNIFKEFHSYSEDTPIPFHEYVFQSLRSKTKICVQQFMPEILSLGEISFVFMNGEFSHSIQKHVNGDGGWVAHEMFGGKNTLAVTTKAQQEWARNINTKIFETFGDLLYARIDGIPCIDGSLKLLECELIVPRLFLREAKAVGKYAELIRHRLVENKQLHPCK